MRFFDFDKAKRIIDESADCLETVTLGLYEDWFWMAREVWAEGKYTVRLPSTATLRYYTDAEREIPLRLARIIWPGSQWATPAMRLDYLDGTVKMIPCFYGEASPQTFEDLEFQTMITSGCLSSEVQYRMPPLEEEQIEEKADDTDMPTGTAI